MAKHKRIGDPLAKRADETHKQWQTRLALSACLKPANDEKLVNPFAEMHGDYRNAKVLDPSGQTADSAKTKINRGGTPICRWEAAGKLTMTQLAVIALCQRLWRLTGLRQQVTANYGERIPGSGNAELGAAREIEAREDLHRLQGHVPAPYWGVFENVCRHSIPAGVASGAGYEGKAAQHRTHTIVCFVADIIAMREGI